MFSKNLFNDVHCPADMTLSAAAAGRADDHRDFERPTTENDALQSFFAAILLTMAVLAPSLWGPASVDPASTTIASGF
jgi:hypothetical protein